jgi:hypothetical protein
MYQISAATLVRIGATLQSMRDFMTSTTPHAAVNDVNRTSMFSHLADIKRSCDELSLNCTGEFIGWVIRDCSTTNRTYAEVGAALQHVSVTLQQELDRHWFGHIDSEKAKYLRHDHRRDHGQSAIRKRRAGCLPHALVDAARARNCFGLGENDACVFHLMRVLEKGLASLAAEFGEPFQFENWHNVIERVESKIRKIDPGSGSAWKDKRQFYSEVACEFMFFKDAWRNHVMHGRSEYDDERAENIYSHVGAFMKHLARGGLREVVP